MLISFEIKACSAGDDGEGEAMQAGRGSKGKRQAAVTADPSSTLEPNIETLNVKKFDIAFAVDPLFHKTSAQFDEGGARGAHWLLNCKIVDSFPWILHSGSPF